MPRDSSGNYTLVAGNPVLSGEVISSSWANNTLDDISTALTNSLDRNGQGGMLAPFRFADGTKEAPGASWSNEITSGFYRPAPGTGDLRISILSNDVMRWNSSGAQLYNAASSQWWSVLTDQGSGSAPVAPGTQEGQMLYWDNAALDWAANANLNISAASLTVTTTSGITTTGLLSARTGSGADALSIGPEAGLTNQGGLSVAVGYRAGKTNQSSDSVAIGEDAGSENQSDYSVAIGSYAGETNQGSESIAIGDEAGNTDQSNEAIAIGYSAGSSTQGEGAIAVGTDAGNDTQGDNSVAIGTGAGNDAQGASGIIINSSGNTLDDSTVGHVHIASSLSSLNYQNIGGVENWNFSSGTVNAPAFAGDGSLLTNVPSAVDNLQAVTTEGNTTNLPITTAGLTSNGNVSVTGDLTVTSAANVSINNYTLPIADGTQGQVLTTDGAGASNWTVIPASATNTLEQVTTAGNTTTNDIAFADNAKATFGADNDLQIYHTGSVSLIKDAGTGGLYLGGSNLISLGSSDFTETYALFNDDGAVILRHDNATRFATTNGGIDVTGQTTTDALLVQTGAITATTSSSTDFLTIQQGGTQAIITADSPDGAANLMFRTTAGGVDQDTMKLLSGGDVIFYDATGVDAKFRWDASAEQLQITGAGGLTVAQNGASVVTIGESSSGDTSTLIMGKGFDVSSSIDFVRAGTSTDAKIEVDDSEQLNIHYNVSDLIGNLNFKRGSTALDTMTLATNGDVEFYNAAGGQAKMVWDASEEQLQIAGRLQTTGTLGSWSIDATGAVMNYTRNSGNYIRASSAGGFLVFQTGGVNERLRVSDTGIDVTGSADVTTSAVNNQTMATFNTSGGVRAVINTDSDDDGAFSLYDKNDAVKVFLRSTGASYLMGGDIGINNNVPDNKLSVLDAGPSAAALLASGNYAAMFGSNTNSAAGITQGIMISGGDNNTRGVALLAETQNSDNRTDFIIATSGSAATPTEKMRITNAGNVGIGTSLPTYPLVVSNSNEESIEFKPAIAAGVNGTIHYDRTGGVYVSNRTQAQTHEWRIGSTTEAMRISDSANVGINDASPAYKLSVGGTASIDGRLLMKQDGTAPAPSVTIGYDWDTGFYRPATNVIGISTFGAERMRIGATGNVSIGTPSDLTKLTVAGSRNAATLTIAQLESVSDWAAGDEFGALDFWSADGSGGGSGVKGGIGYKTTGGTGATTYMTFSVAGAQIGENNIERMRIDDTGIVNVVNRITIADKPVYANNDTGLSSANVYFSNGVAPVSGDGANGDIWYEY